MIRRTTMIGARTGCFLALVAVAPALAAEEGRSVHYAPPAAWVLPPPAPTSTPAPAEAPFRFAYTDTQLHVGPDGQDRYVAWHVRLLKPDALQLGNVSIAWSPADGSATVHRLNLIRDGKVIDVLAGDRFQVIQREGGLEQAVLDGILTAFFQVPGLQVGDELEFASTIHQRDPTLGDHAFGLAQLPLPESRGAFRYRLSWPDATRLAWRTTRDLPSPLPEKIGGRTALVVELRDPDGAIMNDGAPARYNVRRLIEWSDFASWIDVSQRFAMLFDTAAALPPASPLRSEIARIAAASADPRVRTLAALRLVQEQVRYVYVGLDGGNYRPATPDQTWSRRFGDCKAKTVLLLAVLRELGIPAEAVLVNALADDGLNARLPSPGVFNHVLVRATVGPEVVWLDGTRLGDRSLKPEPPFTLRWALPLRRAGTTLEPVAPVAPKRPQSVRAVEIDARAGYLEPARIRAEQVLRDDEALAVQRSLTALSAQDADRALRQFWRSEMEWVEADTVGWHYDEANATLAMTLVGRGRPKWDGNDKQGWSLYLADAGFATPAALKRPRKQDQSAPWLTAFPSFRCWATTVRLPVSGADHHWGVDVGTMRRQLGGIKYWRIGSLAGNVVRTVISRSTPAPEISALEAATLNSELPNFDNKMGRVYQAPGQQLPAADTLPFADGVDWSTNDAACMPASK